jgi:hypothetical protein
VIYRTVGDDPLLISASGSGSDISISDAGAGSNSFISTLFPGGLGGTQDYDIVIIG